MARPIRACRPRWRDSMRCSMQPIRSTTAVPQAVARRWAGTPATCTTRAARTTSRRSAPPSSASAPRCWAAMQAIGSSAATPTSPPYARTRRPAVICRRDLGDFIVQLGIFAVIAGVLLFLNVAQRWLVETLQLKVREAMVTDLVGLWLQPRRAFWLQGSGPMGAHPDQRMHDDTLKLCELS